MAVACGLDRLLADPSPLRGRRYGLLAHGASLTARLVPAHLALAAAGFAPAALFGPEHGFYGVEQDMVASADERDPWTGVPIVSLYGHDEDSLRPRPGAFANLDLVVIDLQDIGSRYYTFAATAAWTAEVALTAGCEVWILDRPNPLDGVTIEGNLPAPGLESFVGAFPIPVRHGLTLGELVRLAASRRDWPGWRERMTVLAVDGWRRADGWEAMGRPWVAPSPNMPTPTTALLYPGACLVEATQLSEGRGTTRPFQLVGAPGLDPTALARRLAERWQRQGIAGLTAIPTYFRPQFQKHGGTVCGGVELALTASALPTSLRAGVELLAAAHEVWATEAFWRTAAYEFVSDRPAIDLLAGCPDARLGIEGQADLDAWYATWAADEAAFRVERRVSLLYPE